jgi:hypothetical protein
MADDDTISPREGADQIAKVMQHRFAAAEPHWSWSGAVEPAFERWRKIGARIEEVRAGADGKAIRDLADYLSGLGLLVRDEEGRFVHADFFAIQSSACQAIAELLLREPRSEAESELAADLLRLCPPQGWSLAYFQLLAEVFDDAGDLGLAKDLAARAYELAQESGEGREVLRALRQLRDVAAITSEEESVPEITGELPELLTAVHIAALLKVKVVTARRKLTDGAIPSVKFGRQRYARREDFLALFDPKGRGTRK